jgi:hypothetical protein
MKKLLILLILLPVLAMGQFGLMDSTKIVRHIHNTLTIEDPIWFTPITTADLLEYEKYCYADSNAILVGFRYIIEEDIDRGMTTYREMYNIDYHLMLEYEEHRSYMTKNYYFDEESVWEFIVEDLKEKYMKYEYPYTGKPYDRNPTYIRCEEITIPMEITFKGFIEWVKK